ncbi:MAG: hypothetical protein ACI4MY_07615, partial [Christensenellales bacterium]
CLQRDILLEAKPYFPYRESLGNIISLRLKAEISLLSKRQKYRCLQRKQYSITQKARFLAMQGVVS